MFLLQNSELFLPENEAKYSPGTLNNQYNITFLFSDTKTLLERVDKSFEDASDLVS